MVTGAGTGFGAATACRVAREGGNVIPTGQRAEPIEAAATGSGSIAIVGEAVSSDHMVHLVATVRDKFCGRDAMVCNACNLGFGTLLDITDNDWAKANRRI